MAAISIVTKDRPYILLGNVYVTAQQSDFIEFEVLETDAASLSNFLGSREYLTCDGDTPFWGELTTLESCTSTAPGLRLLRHKPTLKGRIRIFTDISVSMQ